MTGKDLAKLTELRCELEQIKHTTTDELVKGDLALAIAALTHAERETRRHEQGR